MIEEHKYDTSNTTTKNSSAEIIESRAHFKTEEATSEKYSRNEEATSYPGKGQHISEPFVLCGINYRYEHPNYMTVTENCVDDSTEVNLPDDITVKIFQDGTYTVNLQKGETIDISFEAVRILSQTCDRCNSKTECKMNIEHAYLNMKRINPRDSFLHLLDGNRKQINVFYNGGIKEQYLEGPNCECVKENVNRYFVLRRDLSGAELSESPRSNQFICVLDNFDVKMKEETEEHDSSFHLIKHLYKTYTEHLMSLYDFPLLGMLSNFNDFEEILKVFDYDEKSVIPLRNPLYLLERKIYHIGLYAVIESIVSGFHYFLQIGKKYRKFRPTSSLVNFIKQNTPEVIPEKVVPPIVSPPKKPYVSKLKQLEKRKRENWKLRNEPIPKYFESHYGMAFLILNACIIKCFEIAEEREKERGEQKGSKILESKETMSIASKGTEPCLCNEYASDSTIAKSSIPEKVSTSTYSDICECTNYSLSYLEANIPHESMELKPANSLQKQKSDSSATELKPAKSLQSQKSGSLPQVTVESDSHEDKSEGKVAASKPDALKTSQYSVYCSPSLCCPGPPMPSAVTLCEKISVSEPPTLEDHRTSLDDSVIAAQIFNALKQASLKNNFSSLTQKQVYNVIYSQLKYLTMTKERGNEIIDEVQVLLGICSQNNLFNTAMGMLNSLKFDIGDTLEEDVEEENKSLKLKSSTSHYDDITFRASCIVYDVLRSSHDETKVHKGIGEMKSLLQEARLTKSEAQIVLDLTTQGK